MRRIFIAAYMLIMILPCFYIFVHDVEAGHELAKPYGMNTPPPFFQNSTERGTALGPLFRETRACVFLKWPKMVKIRVYTFLPGSIKTDVQRNQE